MMGNAIGFARNDSAVFGMSRMKSKLLPSQSNRVILLRDSLRRVTVTGTVITASILNRLG